MPGYQKSFDQFRADEGDCRNYAYAAIGGPNAGQPATDAAANNAVAGAALGAAAGALLGAVTGNAGNGAAWGAGTGPAVRQRRGQQHGGLFVVHAATAVRRRVHAMHVRAGQSGAGPGGVSRRAAARADSNWIPPQLRAGFRRATRRAAIRRRTIRRRITRRPTIRRRTTRRRATRRRASATVGARLTEPQRYSRPCGYPRSACTPQDSRCPCSRVA